VRLLVRNKFHCVVNTALDKLNILVVGKRLPALLPVPRLPILSDHPPGKLVSVERLRDQWFIVVTTMRKKEEIPRLSARPAITRHLLKTSSARHTGRPSNIPTQLWARPVTSFTCSGFRSRARRGIHRKPQKYKKVVRLASLGTAMAFEGMHVYNEMKRRREQEAKLVDCRSRE
jgi:hypothetical protein